MWQVERVVLPPGSDGHKFREYGFVHYTERACALKAIEASGQERPVLDGKELSVRLRVSAQWWSIVKSTARKECEQASRQRGNHSVLNLLHWLQCYLHLCLCVCIVSMSRTSSITALAV